MSISNKRLHLPNITKKNIIVFPDNENLDLKSSDHDTESIYESEKKTI